MMKDKLIKARAFENAKRRALGIRKVGLSAVDFEKKYGKLTFKIIYQEEKEKLRRAGE